MPQYRIHRMKEGARETFRWTSHSGDLTFVKMRDYHAGEQVSAPNPYKAWKQLFGSETPLRPGDLLEELPEQSLTSAGAQLFICKYVGFEPAEWYLPESRAPLDRAAVLLPSAPASESLTE